MRFGAYCCAPLFSCSACPPRANMRISEDRGGQIGHYLQAFAALRSSGENVVDRRQLPLRLHAGARPRPAQTASAPRSRARFGFHAAWMPDEDGRPVTSPMGTQALWNIYPGRAALDQPRTAACRAR